MKAFQSPASVDPLLEYFGNYFPLTGEEQDLVRAGFHSRLYRKRQYVLQEGDICMHFNFVARGCLRIYKVDDKGSIHILQFAPENHWINDLGSFHKVRPTSMAIDALEDTVVKIEHR